MMAFCSTSTEKLGHLRKVLVPAGQAGTPRSSISHLVVVTPERDQVTQHRATKGPPPCPFPLLLPPWLVSIPYPLPPPSNPTKTASEVMHKSRPQERLWDWELGVPELEPRLSPEPAMWSGEIMFTLQTCVKDAENHENLYIQKKKGATGEEPWIWGPLFLTGQIPIPKSKVVAEKLNKAFLQTYGAVCVEAGAWDLRVQLLQREEDPGSNPGSPFKCWKATPSGARSIWQGTSLHKDWSPAWPQIHLNPWLYQDAQQPLKNKSKSGRKKLSQVGPQRCRKPKEQWICG